MKLSEGTKLDIQCFVYFLFKGTLDPRLIGVEFDYFQALQANRQALVNCFEIFAYATQGNRATPVSEIVANYILALHSQGDSADLALAHQAIDFNTRHPHTFWSAFLDLARRFCHNTFPRPLRADYVDTLAHNGTDAVPAFAVWTNVIEINDALAPLNAPWALQRANERLKLWENEQPAVKFEDWELEQEIY
jgi:hypothetical protein